MSEAVETPNKRVPGLYLLTNPRSCSNLLKMMMSRQPHVKSTAYFFFDPSLKTWKHLAEKDWNDIPESDRQALFESYQQCYEKMREKRAEINGTGERFLIKEHAVFLFGPDAQFKDYRPGNDVPLLRLQPRDTTAPLRHTNPTCVPDEDLLFMQPLFLIRNPLRMCPSKVRASPEQATTYTWKMELDPCLSFRYSRALYQWYAAQTDGPRPLIIDADDLMEDKEIVCQTCVAAGLDPNAVRYEWNTAVIKDPLKARFLSTLSNSTGIVAGTDARGLEIETESVKWKEEFGEEEGEKLTRFVREAMPDYDFLWNRRVGACNSEDKGP